ncbi:hypothetical protein BAUCODRAFT_368095 [Baudoinia panamericana UAMH 10762]|uniref:Uncharacterized protein n=1 Tax=Baudoinia panamericana (strain UAMH 10762) TaxID=717646 RepID=M2MTG2_BAUPA|nr:uncharacterized protein BAUCODRAFT_368095 [Baudoinia panamericana UAMH 10762]EMD00192.1 hypothetical protein BAUCODRAFT_368095 [Baudoinia panamericana UAMH 10762]
MRAFFCLKPLVPLLLVQLVGNTLTCAATPLLHPHQLSSHQLPLLTAAAEEWRPNPLRKHEVTSSRPSTAGRRRSHLDAAPNSVGILFTSSHDEEKVGVDVEVVHAWVPLGRMIHTHDSPELPLRPQTARITTLIHSTPEIASPEHLDRVVCTIYPKWNASNEVPDPDVLAVELKRGDGMVRLVGAGAGAGPRRNWREVDTVECR